MRILTGVSTTFVVDFWCLGYIISGLTPSCEILPAPHSCHLSLALLAELICSAALWHYICGIWMRMFTAFCQNWCVCAFSSGLVVRGGHFCGDHVDCGATCILALFVKIIMDEDVASFWWRWLSMEWRFVIVTFMGECKHRKNWIVYQTISWQVTTG